MKWKSLFFLFSSLLMQKLFASQDKSITTKKISGKIEFTCISDKWFNTYENVLSLEYNDDNSGDYHCNSTGLTVKFRSCDNCIELDAFALSAIILGNFLATVLIGFAVYSIIGQPKGKNPSSSKASDKVNLLPNGDRDTYQQLTPGQNSEYSGLMRKK